MDARTDDRGGLGRRNRPRRTPKGRQVDPRALTQVCALLGDRERAAVLYDLTGGYAVVLWALTCASVLAAIAVVLADRSATRSWPFSSDYSAP